MRKYLPIARENKVSIFAVTIIALLNAAITFLIPISVSKLMENQFQISTIVMLFVLISISLVMGLLLTLTQQYFTKKFQYNLSNKLYDDLFHLKYEKYNDNGAAYYIDKIMGAVNNYSKVLMDIIPGFIETWLIMIISIIIIGTINIPILAAICSILFLQNWGYKKINEILSEKCINLSNVCSKSYANIVSLFEKTDYVKQQSEPKKLLNIIDHDIKERYQVTAEVNIFAGGVSRLLSALVMNAQYSIYIVLGVMALSNRVSSTSFILGTMVINILFENVRALVGINLNMKDANASYDFVENELRKNREIDGTQRLDHINTITVKDVNIGYGDNTLIEHINISIGSGDHIFVKAETGAGKSSFVKTLVRFYDANGIYVNGMPIEKIQLKELRNKIAYISQQASVINGSLIDNLFMGDEYLEEKEKVIAKLPFMKKFTNGEKIKDIKISSSGSNLSGGDKQKIMISRLFMENPDVIILDEITSSMDEGTSKMVYETIFDRFSDKIIIMISHKDSAAKYANIKWTLENKHILEELCAG